MFYLCNITQKNFCKEGSEFMDIKQLIGETTDYDKKLALEEKKPKSWCKSISAFANCFGGKLIFGVSNDSELVGLADAESDAEKISEIIKTIMKVMDNSLHLCVLEMKVFQQHLYS